MVQPPAGAPAAVAQVIAAGNAIATLPYIWGGGHGSFHASGYDCSGSVSYALAAAGLLSSPLDSTGFESWGEPGPGQWITVYANAGHAFMVVAGWRFDTVAPPPAGPGGRRRWRTRPGSSPATRPGSRAEGRTDSRRHDASPRPPGRAGAATGASTGAAPGPRAPAGSRERGCIASRAAPAPGSRRARPSPGTTAARRRCPPERVGEPAEPHQRREPVQLAPAGGADRPAGVVAEAEQDQTPSGDDPDRRPGRLVPGDERDRDVGERRVQELVAEQRDRVHDDRGERRERQASCVERRSGPLRRSSLVLISRPSDTARLARIRAAKPAARLVIQNR